MLRLMLFVSLLGLLLDFLLVLGLLIEGLGGIDEPFFDVVLEHVFGHDNLYRRGSIIIDLQSSTRLSPFTPTTSKRTLSLIQIKR